MEDFIPAEDNFKSFREDSDSDIVYDDNVNEYEESDTP
jgi:hypothetical protein